MQQRSVYDITAEILTVITKPTPPTHVLHDVKLSSTGLRYYRSLLLGSELMQINDGSKWVITEKGQRYLAAYEDLAQILNAEARLIQNRLHTISTADPLCLLDH